MREDWSKAKFGTMFCKKHDRHFLSQYACPECYTEVEEALLDMLHQFAADYNPALSAVDLACRTLNHPENKYHKNPNPGYCYCYEKKYKEEE